MGLTASIGAVRRRTPTENLKELASEELASLEDMDTPPAIPSPTVVEIIGDDMTPNAALKVLCKSEDPALEIRGSGYDGPGVYSVTKDALGDKESTEGEFSVADFDVQKSGGDGKVVVNFPHEQLAANIAKFGRAKFKEARPNGQRSPRNKPTVSLPKSNRRRSSNRRHAYLGRRER